MDDPIRRWLTRAGPSGPSSIQRGLEISRSHLQRWLAANRDQLVVHGRARATTYALARPIEGLLTPTPMYEVQADGGVEPILTLHPIEPFGFYVQAVSAAVSSGFFAIDPKGPDLPWFLHDLRPEGYLARAWVSAHADERYPTDLERWSSDEVLRFCAQHGTDLPGAFVVGPFARGRLRDRITPSIPEGDRATEYPRRATELLNALWPGGSTPGGEQPKFTVRVRERERSCIVKFSPPMHSAVGRRWADLLAVEHLVHELLPTFDPPIEAARSEIVDAGGRRFLEVQRFDRHGSRGRSGVLTLAALDVDGIGHELRSWSAITGALVDAHRIDPSTHERVAWLAAFGLLIANTDMHPGNFALRMQGSRLLGPAPVYDMLPMHFAPRFGELVDRPYDPHSERATWPPSAVRAARRLWMAVLGCPQISEGFKRLAANQLRSLPHIEDRCATPTL